MTTVLDLWKWDRALRGDRVLGEAARQKLFEPVLHDYACGWFVTKSVHGTPRIQHGGGVRGFVSDLRRYPQGADDGCIAVLANADDVPVYVIADNLECLLFGKPLRHAPPPELATLSPDELRAFAGEYQSPDGARLVVRADGDALSVGVEGQALLGELTTLRVAGSALDLEASSRLAVEIVEAVARGDEAPLRAQMAPGIPPSWPGVVKSKIWPEHARQHGALRSVKALGATARGDRVVVVLALDHEGTPSRVKIELDPAGLQILDWHGPEFPLALRLLPVGGGAFVEFGWQQTRRFEFVTADGEHGTDVVGLRVGERELARVPR